MPDLCRQACGCPVNSTACAVFVTRFGCPNSGTQYLWHQLWGNGETDRRMSESWALGDVR